MTDFLRRHKTAILLASTLLYDVSPVDMIPDVIPMLGWFDDLGVTGIAAMLALWWWRDRSRAQQPSAATPTRAPASS